MVGALLAGPRRDQQSFQSLKHKGNSKKRNSARSENDRRPQHQRDHRMNFSPFASGTHDGIQKKERKQAYLDSEKRLLVVAGSAGRKQERAGGDDEHQTNAPKPSQLDTEIEWE